MADTSTVGGVMSGYWAIGSCQTAMKPPSVMMIDITEAAIGRLMKNFENTSIPHFCFTELADFSFPSSAWERPIAKLCFAACCCEGREAELPDLRSQAELGNEGNYLTSASRHRGDAVA